MIELLIVTTIIMIMAAVAFPNISGYIKNYRIKGAAQLVAGELNAARSRAIMSNTNNGVSFVVLDRDHFRFVQEDMTAGTTDSFSGLKQLPTGVYFVAPGGAATQFPGATLRFLRLGGFCNPANTSVTSCQPAVAEINRHTDGEKAMLDPSSVDGPYIAGDAAGTMTIRVRELSTNLERTVQIAPGGRVLPQP